MCFKQQQELECRSEECNYEPSLHKDSCFLYQVACQYAQRKQEITSQKEHGEHLQKHHSKPKQKCKNTCGSCVYLSFKWLDALRLVRN